MAVVLSGFKYSRVAVDDRVEIAVAVGGSGPPIVLLHGFPQTHLMWRHVADDLAADHTVICPDLRGYGDSDKPDERDASTYSKRTMAADIVAVAAHLGFDRFSVVGHDRGALVAFRAGLDHPASITHVGCIDVVPTSDMWDVLSGRDAAVAFHLYLMAQPPGLPEQMIEASADEFFGYFLDAWTQRSDAIGDDVRAEYLRASGASVTSIVADYRASAVADVEHDQADRAAGHRLTMPVSVMQRDWGDTLGYDAANVWGAWANDLVHTTIDTGHFMAEEDPASVVAMVRGLVARRPSGYVDVDAAVISGTARDR